MSNLANILVFLGAGIGGGLLAAKLVKLPGMTIVGAMVSVMLVKTMLSSGWNPPRGFAMAVEIALGVLVGCTWNPQMAKELVTLLGPIVASCLVLVFAGVLVAGICVKLGVLDMTTAYLGTSPGAMSALMSISLDSKANPPVVAAFHFFRLVFIIVTAPFVYQLLQYFVRK